MDKKSNQLTSERCALRRNRSIETSGEIGVEYQKAIAVKKVLLDAIEKGYSQSEIYDSLCRGFVDIEFPTDRTREIIAYEMTNCILRYIRSEKRKPEIKIPAKVINNFGINVEVKPDLIFVFHDYIEVVKVKAGRPTVTQTGKKSVENNLELYSLFSYGKELVPVGSIMHVRASYYYLRKSTDSTSKNEFSWDFFDGEGRNVVSIEDVIDKTVFPEGAICDLDIKFEPQFEKYYEGSSKEELSEEDCAKCDFKNICGYKHTPQYVTKEHKVKSMKDLNLTEAQEKAISFNKGIARINAGAGAGKTLVVALRVVNLILNGTKPEEICLLTFTNSGASEMKERVQLYNADFGTGADVLAMVSTTFNGFADNIVRKEYLSLGFTEPPTLIDEIERSGVIAELLKNNVINGLDYRNFSMNTKYVKGALPATKKCFDIIKKYSLSLGDEKELMDKLGTDVRFFADVVMTDMIELFAEYDSILRQNNWIEYADQEILMFEMLHQDPYYFEQFGFKHIIIDEFQDTDQKQLELIKELRNCPTYESLMVVGDDSQAIFSFRDTSPEYIVNFFELMGEEGEDFFLLDNHRSTGEIITLANKINALNKDRIEKDLVATREMGRKPVVKGFFHKDDEYDYVANQIKEKIVGGTKPEDIAFIASNKYELLDMGSKLTTAGIPWIMLNPEPTLENPKVLAAIGIAKAICNTGNTEAILTYLNALYENRLLEKSDEQINLLINGLKAEIETIAQASDKDKQKAFHDLIEALNDDDELYENFLEKLERKSSFNQEIKYLLDFEAYGENETYKRCKDYPGVVLSTAHSSKGLEWPIVFTSITKFHGKELGTGEFGSTSCVQHKRIEEKRRLLFVSLTRASDELYITGQYVAFGSKENRTYNMFLREVCHALDCEYNPINPLEEEEERLRKEKIKEKAAERRKREREARKEQLENKNTSSVALPTEAA